MAATDPQHRQDAYPVRLEWGPVGAEAIGPLDIAVVVDVLSFTTTLTVAVERGVEVFPFRWRDDRAEAYAGERDAVLAVQRQDAVSGRPSLSPASLREADGVRRLVLPSPNGSSISRLLAEAGATVVGASLRNRSAVADWLAARRAGGRASPSSRRGSVGRTGPFAQRSRTSGAPAQSWMPSTRTISRPRPLWHVTPSALSTSRMPSTSAPAAES